MEKLRTFFKKNLTAYIILAVVIAVQLCHISYVFVYEKEGWHCDDVYSYGLANSFYMPFLQAESITTPPEDYEINEWKSGTVLHNYITVQPDRRFRYDAVWYNQSQDRHPPLFYAALHTVCSFFPDTFSPWFGFSLNILYFVIAQIFLYKLARNMLKSKYLAILVCAFYGFTAGALSIVIFIRMYCMLTMWAIIFMYLHSKLYLTKEQPLLRQLIPITMITACGTLTQYLFLFVAFVTAVCFCVRYLLTKRFKVFFAYGFSVLGGVLLAFAIFPPAVHHLFSEVSSGSNNPFSLQILISLRYFSHDVLGFYWIHFWCAIYIFFGIAAILAVLSLPIQFLFRNNPKLRSFYRNIISDFKSKIKNFRLSAVPKQLYQSVKRCSPMTFIMLLCIVFLLVIVSYTTNFLFVGYVDRYYFIVYPFIILSIVSIICFVFSKIKYKKVITAVLVIFLSVVSIVNTTTLYLFPKNCSLDELKNLTTDAQCILIYSSPADTAAFCIMPPELEYADSYFLTHYTDTENVLNLIDQADENKPTYLIMTENSFVEKEDGRILIDCTGYGSFSLCIDDYLKIFEKLNITKEISYVGDYTLMETNYLIYRLA